MQISAYEYCVRFLVKGRCDPFTTFMPVNFKRPMWFFLLIKISGNKLTANKCKLFPEIFNSLNDYSSNSNNPDISLWKLVDGYPMPDYSNYATGGQKYWVKFDLGYTTEETTVGTVNETTYLTTELYQLELSFMHQKTFSTVAVLIKVIFMSKIVARRWFLLRVFITFLDLKTFAYLNED